MEARTDDFHSPKPKKAAAKSAVNAVLSAVSSMGTSLLSLLSGLLAAALILYSGFVLYDSFYTQEQAKSSWDLLQYKPEILEDGDVPQSVENLLANINPDYRAWLTVHDTNIDYPVMQGADDLYYATRDIYKEISLTGAIYLAAGNQRSFSDSYNLIYGHHMDNMAMFGGLDLYGVKDSATQEIVSVNSGYFNGHREGLLVSESAVYDLNAFALVKTDAYQNRIYSVGNRMGDVLTFLRANVNGADASGANFSDDTVTLYLDEAALSGATKIVALSTCASASTNGRLLVFYTATQRNLLTVEARGDSWTYDGLPHTLQDLSEDGSHQYVKVNYPGDNEHPTTVEYSVDGGRTWTTEPPRVTNASESTDVIVRVTNDLYGRATTTVRLEAQRKSVRVIADPDQHKTYGQQDPILTATAEGLEGNDTLTFTVTRPRAGVDEAAGTYTNAVVPQGDAIQGNYTVTYVPANFTIVQPNVLRVTATGFEGAYDGRLHVVHAMASVTEGTVIEYSVDNGRTWSREAPSLQNVGEMTVVVRASNPNYRSATVTVRLQVTPKAVTVRANGASKVFGDRDPAFTATVTGLVGRDTVTYTVTRPQAGTDENAGQYRQAIVPQGQARQGNYALTYVPATFTITSSDQLVLNVTDQSWVYDGEAHTPAITTSAPNGTTIEYSTDGGRTWIRRDDRHQPSITDVGVQEVLIRASNPNYETVITTVTLRVTPAPVTVHVHNSVKVYGEEDPEFVTTINGLVADDDVLEFAVTRPDAARQENVGSYPGAIVAQGDSLQGNYIVTYVNGDFEITAAVMSVKAEGYSGVYDGEEHRVQVDTTALSPEDDANTVVEYSTDGGRTWTTEAPSLRDVGEEKVLVRVTNPNYAPVEVEVELKITPRQVIVIAGDYSKVTGSDDPEFTPTIEGLLEGDSIQYTITRAEGDEPDSYVIRVEGEESQGNYTVVFYSGVLRVVEDDSEPTPSPEPTAEPVEIPDPEPPLAKVFKPLEPRGNGERKVWALLNLLCLIITIYLFIPLLHLRAKFDRARLMKKINRSKGQLRSLQGLTGDDARDKTRLEQLVRDARKNAAASGAGAGPADGEIREEEFGVAVEELYYKVKRFLRRFRLGMIFELIFSALSLIIFLLTEDLSRPMVLIDRWTPVMIVLMILVCVLDIRFIRYREKVLADEEEAERRRLEQERIAAASK